jgi:hypothetical protein
VTERERVIRLNGIGGVRFQKTRIEFSIRVFSLRTFVILSEAKNLGSFLRQRWNEQPEMFRLAQHDNTIRCPCIALTELKIHAHH